MSRDYVAIHLLAIRTFNCIFSSAVIISGNLAFLHNNCLSFIRTSESEITLFFVSLSKPDAEMDHDHINKFIYVRDSNKCFIIDGKV